MANNKIQFLSQLIQSMNDAVIRLEQAINEKRENEIEQIKSSIYDIYKKIREELAMLRSSYS